MFQFNNNELILCDDFSAMVYNFPDLGNDLENIIYLKNEKIWAQFPKNAHGRGQLLIDLQETWCDFVVIHEYKFSERV